MQQISVANALKTCVLKKLESHDQTIHTPKCVQTIYRKVTKCDDCSLNAVFKKEKVEITADTKAVPKMLGNFWATDFGQFIAQTTN